MSDDVLYDVRDSGVAVITLNRPDSLNSLGGQIVPLLGEYLGRATNDRGVRCVVLTGAGRAFCAGGDIKTMEGRGPGAVSAERSTTSVILENARELAGWHRSTVFTIHTMPKPVIGMINGHAVGAGLGIALSCDIRIASDRARFGTAFRNVGLSSDFGGVYFLQKLAGMGRARELYFSAEVLDAQQALAAGLVNRVVAHDELERETMVLAETIAAGPTLALGTMKEMLNLAATADLGTVLEREALTQRLMMFSADHKEAVTAFREKRPPRFAGR